jgi:hypothetical protein
VMHPNSFGFCPDARRRRFPDPTGGGDLAMKNS